MYKNEFTQINDDEMKLNNALVDKALMQLLAAGNTFLTLNQIEAAISRITNQTIQLGSPIAKNIRYVMNNKLNFKFTRKRLADGTRPHGYLFTGSDDDEMALNKALVDKALMQLLAAGNTFLTLNQIEAAISKITNQTIQLSSPTAKDIRCIMNHKLNFKFIRKVQADGTRPHGYLFIGDDKTNVD